MKRIFVIVGCIVALALGCAGCSEQGGKVPSLDDPTPSSSCGGVGQDPCEAPCEEGQVLDSVDGNEVCVESCTGGKAAVDGVCLCPEGMSLVGDSCLLPTPGTDCPVGQALIDGNCAVVTVCSEGQAFVDGKCVPIETCPEGQALVDGKCVDAPIKVCLGIGQIVVDGKCVCPTGKVLKGNQCVVDEGLGGFQPIGPVGPITGICLLPLVKGLDGKCACPLGTVFNAETNTCNMVGGGLACAPGFVKNEAGVCVSAVGGGVVDVGKFEASGISPGTIAVTSSTLSLKEGHALDIMPSPPSGDLKDLTCPAGYVVAGLLKVNNGKAEGVSSSRQRVSGISVKCKDINALAKSDTTTAGSILSESHPGDAIDYKIPAGFALAGWMAGSTEWHAWDTNAAKWRTHIFLTKLRPIAKRIGSSGLRDDVLWVGSNVAANSGEYSISDKNGVKINNSLKLCPDGEVMSSVRLYTGQVKVSTRSYFTVKSISGQCVKVEGGSAIKPTGKAKVELARGDDGKIAVSWKEVEMGDKIDVSTVKEVQCAKTPIGEDEDMALSGASTTLKKGSYQIRGMRIFCTSLDIMNRPSLEELLLTDYADDLLPQGVTHYGKQEAQFSKSIHVMDNHDGDKTVINNFIPLNFVATGIKVGSYDNRISAVNMYAGLVDTALGLDRSWERSILSTQGTWNKENGSAECGAGEVLTGVRLAFDNADVMKAVYAISCAKVVPAD